MTKQQAVCRAIPDGTSDVGGVKLLLPLYQDNWRIAVARQPGELRDEMMTTGKPGQVYDSVAGVSKTS